MTKLPVPDGIRAKEDFVRKVRYSFVELPPEASYLPSTRMVPGTRYQLNLARFGPPQIMQDTP